MRSREAGVLVSTLWWLALKLKWSGLLEQRWSTSEQEWRVKYESTDLKGERWHSRLGLSSDSWARVPAHEDKRGKSGLQLPAFDEARHRVLYEQQDDTTQVCYTCKWGKVIRTNVKVVLPVTDCTAIQTRGER